LDQNPDYQAIKAPAEKVLTEIGEKFVPFREQDSTPKESKEIFQHLSKRQKEEKPIETVPVEKPNPVQKKELEEKDKYMDEAGKVFPTEYANDGIKLSNRSYIITKIAVDPAEKTAESLFKIIQFLQYRVPKKNKKKYLNRIKGKVIKLSPAEMASKKIPLSATIGQSIAISKNILSGLSPVFINKVLEKLIRLLISNQEN
jgi:transcription termination factor NusB